jgi:glycine cleavage system regulatory protein
MDSFVLTIIGTDRAGLVQALSDVVADHGGNWERSHVTELEGMFAGVVLVRVPRDRSDAFRDALVPLHDQGLLDVTLRPARSDESSEQAVTVGFEVVGADRVGIVREVSHALTSLGVSITDLRTWTESAPMAGGALFHAAAVVRLPDGVDQWGLMAALEDLADDLMVDVFEPSRTTDGS